jgi:hypothetical protein
MEALPRLAGGHRDSTPADLDARDRDVAWSTDAEQTGATVCAEKLSWNATIAPGRSVTFGFIGANPGGPNPIPALFTLNGAACT